MRNAIILAFVFLFVGSTAIFATPQFPDILIYNGKEYPIGNDYMADYFDKFPERNPRIEDERCSALWRGYRSKFEVVNEKLVLKDIVTGVCLGPTVSALKKVVPSGETLYIDWVIGFVTSGYGYNLDDPYSVEHSEAFEKYSVFQIDKGKIVEVRNYNNKGFRELKKKQFEAFKKTKEYDLEVKAILKRQLMSPADVDWNIQFAILSYTKAFLFK